MNKSPIISALLTVPTLAENGRSQLTVGIQLSDGQRFWADCVAVTAASRMGETAVFDPVQAANHVQTIVAPLWQGQSASQFRSLAQRLIPLTEPFTYRPTLPARAESISGTVSRRSLITGFLAEEPPPPNPEEVTIERPLHPTLHYGLTAALLQASAAVNRISVAEWVAREYALALPDTAVPLQIALNEANIQTAQHILATHVASLGYTTSKNNHKANLGSYGERLQQHIRQVAAWLPSLSNTFQPTLHLDLQGGPGALFDNDAGKVLGLLAGLEHAAKPYLVQVQNPVWLDGREKQIEHLKRLKNYLALRKMKLQLVADAWVDSLADVALFADPAVCQMVHIELPKLGNLEVGITAVLHLLAQNQPVLLSGEAHPLTTQLALATRPTRLSGSPKLHYNVMQQLLHQE